MYRSSLSSDTIDALARDVPVAGHCRDALRAGLAYFSGARRASVVRLMRSLGEGASDGLPPALPKARCDRRMELRAAFLACGSLAVPAAGYHLEFVPASQAAAERIVRLVRAEGVAAGLTRRKAHIVVYLKSLDGIVTVLSAAGAHAAVLRLEDLRAVKETRNRIHRLVNTEVANVVRAAGAAATQRDAIAYLAEAYGLRNLTPALREAAQLRLAHPDETLAELGRRCIPPVGKPTINGRIAALMRLVRRLRAPQEQRVPPA